MATPFAAPSCASSVIPRDWRERIVVATDERIPADTAIAAARTLAGHGRFRTTAMPADDASISQFAGELRADLIVTSIGNPCVLQRLLGDEFTLRLARAVRTPTFAAAQGVAIPPRRVVVGMDFSPASMNAARLAAAIAPGAELILVHVATPSGRARSDGALKRCAELLQEGFKGRITPVELTGDAATELLALANTRSADAIAIGTHGEGIVAAGLIGPVATRVIRCAACSVLIGPWADGLSPNCVS